MLVKVFVALAAMVTLPLEVMAHAPLTTTELASEAEESRP
jgi:hypothetical protein